MAAKIRDITGYKGAVLIGRGGFGAVYRAADAAHGREVAIKVLPGHLDEAERRRFDRERQTMGRLGAHPFIIPVYESGYTEDGEGYIVMELASGGSLRDRLRNEKVPWDEAAKIMAAVADAAQAAHDSEVLHRDIKPDNILIDQFGNPKLSDFGIAAVASNATSTATTTATIAHAAPELLQGDRGSTAIDIYAIGSTLHTLITGRPPFLQPGDNGVAPMIRRAISDPPPDLRSHGVPDGMARVIEQAMAKPPADRHTSARALAEDLRAGRPSSLPISPGSPAAPPTQPAQQARATQIAPGAPPLNPTTGRSEPRAFPPPQHHASAHDGQLAANHEAHGYQHVQGYQAKENQQAPTGAAPGGQPQPQPHPHPGGIPSWQEVQNASGAGSSPWAGRIGLLALFGVTLLAALGVLLLALRDDDTSPSDDQAQTDPAERSLTDSDGAGVNAADAEGNPTASSPATGAVTNGPTVIVECPESVPYNSQTYCSIFTTNAISGEWSLPAFLPNPEPIEIVPGEYEIFVEPTNPASIGQTFTITATVAAGDGTTASANHTFTVIDDHVVIDCPTEIELNAAIECDIVSKDAVSGSWSIPSFGSAELQVVPGRNPIFIEPKDPASVGQSYMITATVSDAAGLSYEATSSFVVVSATG